MGLGVGEAGRFAGKLDSLRGKLPSTCTANSELVFIL